MYIRIFQKFYYLIYSYVTSFLNLDRKAFIIHSFIHNRIRLFVIITMIFYHIQLSIIACSFILYIEGLKPLCPLPPFKNNDDVHLSCEVEVGSYTKVSHYNLPSDGLNIVEYNIDRNGYGGDGDNENGLEPIIKLLSNPLLIHSPDILVLSEVGRGCESYGGVDLSGAEEIAKNLSLNFVYAVEYVVISESNETDECSIGNALLSKYQITNIQQLRFKSQCCRYPDRYGGRIDLIADVTLSSKPGSSSIPDTLLHVHSSHLESGQSNAKMVIESLIVREQQAAEMTNITWTDNIPIIIAGDLNSPGPKIDPTILRLKCDGFTDSMENFTIPLRPLIQFDYILSSPSVLSDAGYCKKQECKGLSDHVPFWAKYVPLVVSN